MVNGEQRARIFISYSRKDRELTEKFCEHLAPLQHQGLVEVWYDERIPSGVAWRRMIEERLESADMVVLLGSAAFLQSAFCREEMRRAIELQKKGNLQVVPVRLRAFVWDGTPFEELQSLPRDGKPIAGHPNIDDVCAEIVREILLRLRSWVPAAIDRTGAPAILQSYAKVCDPLEDLQTRASLLEAKALWTKALAAAQDTPDHPEVSDILHRLGLTLLDLGEIPAARDAISRSLDLYENDPVSDQSALATRRSHLAEILRLQGDLDRALDLARKAVDAEPLGGEPRDQVARLNNLALVLAAQGRPEQAKARCKEAVAIGAYFQLEETPEIAATLHNLALLLKADGDLHEAERYLLQAIAADEEHFGPEHPQVALDRHSLGLVLEQRGHGRRARKQFHQAHKILAATLGEEHPQTAVVRQSL